VLCFLRKTGICLRVYMFAVAYLVIFSITVVSSAYEVIFRKETHPMFAKKSRKECVLVLFLSLYIHYNIITNYNK